MLILQTAVKALDDKGYKAQDYENNKLISDKLNTPKKNMRRLKEIPLRSFKCAFTKASSTYLKEKRRHERFDLHF